MENLISKELLSEVLGCKIWKVLDCNMGTLRYCIYPNKGDEPSEYMFPINIHELSHKCKEWAFKIGYNIFIQRHGIGSIIYEAHIKCDRFNMKIKYNEFAQYFPKEKTEPISIFKACQWVLDNKESK